jgi:inorganic pyrophosphatase
VDYVSRYARKVALINGWACAAALSVMLVAQEPVPNELPPAASAALINSLTEAQRHLEHVWRDTPPFNPDGTVAGYIEISRGDRRKWEFDMGANKRAVDRVMPEDIGGYPINYGFVPQTVSYDGDPFDVLVMGPAIPGGTLVRGAIVGLLYMEDEKGLDAKVVLSRTGADGRPRHLLTERDREEVSAYFRRYKQHEPGKFSKVAGWGSAADGLAYVNTTHAFFRDCRQRPATACRVMLKPAR